MTIYKITNTINGMLYIGQTINSLKKRWTAHKNLGPTNACRYLKAAIRKYGPEAFVVTPLATYTNAEDLNNAEEYFIDFLNTLVPNGYNLTTGGGARRPTEETLQKLRRPSPKKGKPMSLESRLKMSVSRMGKSPWNKGKTGVYSKEHLELLSKIKKEAAAKKNQSLCKETKGA